MVGDFVDTVKGPRPAVFLDRDGVLIRDTHLLTNPEAIQVMAGAGEAVCRLKAAGFAVVVVTNQTVIARGLIDMGTLELIHNRLQQMLPCPVDEFYVCPHHPSANLEEFRVECECRKPRSGLIFQACRDLNLACDRRSFLVGDRMTDIAAGSAAGCTTILVESGRHTEPPIESPDPVPADCRADHTCEDLEAASTWILLTQEGSFD